MLKISEIFYSLQGEGTRAGKICVFIRLASCNLRCKWCDTEYALDYTNSQEFSINEIMQKIKTYNCNFVEITGGEPLFQTECIELANTLLKSGYEVAIETNGSLSIANLSEQIIKIMDIKCPCSEMSEQNLYENINYLTKKDELKFVVASKSDFDWAISIIEKYSLYKKINNILFSAIIPNINYNELADLILSIKNKNIKNIARMQLQFHKIIWKNERGK